jgi:hypothetical protein
VATDPAAAAKAAPKSTAKRSRAAKPTSRATSKQGRVAPDPSPTAKPTSRSTSKQSEQLRDVLVEAAQTQLAAITAAITFWSGWAQSAEKYAQTVSAELAKINEGAPTGDLVGRLTDLTRAYVRNLTTLPTAAVAQFTNELDKVGKPKTRRTRAARVKP